MASSEYLRELVSSQGSPLLLTYLSTIESNYNALQRALPNVKLFYALKPFPHGKVVERLNTLGSYFDLATTGEIEVVKKLGITADKCIHTHPIKRDKDIKAAIKFGITTFVVDNEDEITKFKKYKKKVKLLLRLSFRSPTASIDLSKKFGCDPKNAFKLIELARSYGIQVTGLSFHVGSQCKDATMHAFAIKTCHEIIAGAILKGLPPLTILDIGGGFPAWYGGQLPLDIIDFCEPIRNELRKLPDHISVFAEPGRYIVAESTLGISTIMGKSKRDGKIWYYLDDGIYGSYSAHVFDGVQNPIRIVAKDDREFGVDKYPSVLAGPTCDSVDVIYDNINLPELQIGDLIIGQSMGAYSWATSTNFNFFDRAKLIFID